MRTLLVVASLCLTTARGEACPIYDYTFVRGSYVAPRPMYEEPQHGPVVPNPRLFIHLGTDSKPGLPEFIRDDGSRIPYTLDVVDETRRVFQADLKIASGRILVRHAGELGISETFVIVPSFVPSTRGVRVGKNELEIDSDAVTFRLEENGRRDMWFNWGSLNFDPRKPLRVTALYGDRREEVIFDYRPARPVSPAVFAMLCLIVATLVAIRSSTKLHEGTAA